MGTGSGRWRQSRRLFRMRLHNRLMLYNTLIFLLVAYSLAYVSTQYALKLNRVTQLQQSRDVLHSLYNYYDIKQDEFLNLLFPLYEVQENYASMSRLLESSSDFDYENDPFNKQEIVGLAQSIATRDPDIAAVLLRKNLTGAQYVYNSRSRTLSLVPDSYPFFNKLRFKGAGRTLFGTTTIDGGSSSISDLQLYGIAGTLGTADIRLNAGQILIAYSTQALQRIYQGSSDKTLGRFVIVTEDGELVYDSEGRYGQGGFSELETLKSGADKVTLAGKRYYVQTVKSGNRNYIAANFVPRELLDRNGSHLPYLIFGAVTAMALVCALLYSLAGSLAFRRVRELIRAMKVVGSNNLSYRIPLRARTDEFEELAKRFNGMCDDLQERINREYASEIRKKNAELKALQAGLNPHFLYNTLEAIRIKAFDDGNANIAEMIVLLANLYRSIVRDNTFIPIRKEIGMCSMYVEIFALRHASRFDFEVDVDPRAMEYGIPKNLLQPVIENYFVHGIREQSDNNRFVIRGFMEEGDIYFHIEDNGKGLHPDRLQEVRSGLESSGPVHKSSYGLYSAHERIQLVYGSDYGIRMESEANRLTRVIVRIPAMTCGQLNQALTHLSVPPEFHR
ncbi:sensor histidine kinase [Cohnella cellulosilytica]|uniref:Sensor histidine kinase n=1 Tax=Cohnella cellulosilytica TaxID=986710 RepID=A0ABW2FPJ0_9BACL